MIRVLAREGKHLRVRGGTKATQEHADKQQDKIVAVPGEQHAGKHAEQAAENNQAFAIAFSVGAACQKLADENADDGTAGKEEANHRRTGMNFVGQEQAQRWRL